MSQSSDIIIVENLPGFSDLKFYKVNQPAFLDHTLEGQAVVTREFTLPEIREAILKPNRRTYIYECTQTKGQAERGKYQFRLRTTEDKLAPLFVELNINQETTIDLNTHRPMRRGAFGLSIEMVNDLTIQWGRDEVVRQIGEHFVRGIEVCDRNEKSDPLLHSGKVNEHADPVNSHQTQAE